MFTAALINSQPMGFYSARALVAEAQRHGVEVRPVCVHASDWDCTLEPLAGGGTALRLGLRLVRSLRQVDGERVVACRREGQFVDISSFAVRTRLDRGALTALADADAFAVLGVERRRARWILDGLWTDAPLFAPVPRPQDGAVLPVEGRVDGLIADYRAVGLSVTSHPIEVMRADLDRQGVRPVADVVTLEPGARVAVAGLVSCRQRPGTAHGVVFMTFEDESGMLNLIVWPKTWQRFRRVARSSNLLGARGKVQREGDAVSVLVEELWALEGLESLATRSRDFH